MFEEKSLRLALFSENEGKYKMKNYLRHVLVNQESFWNYKFDSINSFLFYSELLK